MSNLTFTSKLVERLVSLQLTEFLERNNLLPKFQSGFRKRHSTETALLKVMSDILLAADQGHVTLLGLLDMSAAFDIVDHDILLFRLKTSFGVDGTVLSWLESFLRDRTQQVAFKGQSSALVKVTSGVPQGRRAGGQAGRRAGGQAGRRAGGQAGRRAGGQAGKRAGGQAGRQAGGHAGRRAGGQAGRRASGQAGRRAGGLAGRRAGGQAGR